VSEENVEFVRRVLSEQVPALYRIISDSSPDFVWDMSTFEGWPDQGEFHGLAEFMRFLARWVEPYDEWGAETEDILDAGSDTVVALLHQKGRLSGSESWVEMHYAIVYTVQDGLLTRAQVYATAAEALEAVGLDGRLAQS